MTNMKEIECPSCGEMIPDDSKYCDMCGVELLECVNCGAVGCGNFCGTCGGAMVSRGNAVRVAEPHRTVSSVPVGNSRQETDAAGGDDAHSTGKGRVPRLRWRGGNVVLVPRDGAIIGRKEGEYAAQLKDFDLISRRHGKFVKQGRAWCLVDLDSTNGCLVNDVELVPHVPTAFKKGDVVDIGTYEFDVV